MIEEFGVSHREATFVAGFRAFDRPHPRWIAGSA
jgi:hypothetical protein